MAVITKQELEDAAVDAQTLEDVANSTGTVVSRLGASIKTVRKAIDDLQTVAPAITYATEAALLADLVPENGQLAYALNTDTYYVKNGATGTGSWDVAPTNKTEALIQNQARKSLWPDTLFKISGNQVTYQFGGVDLYAYGSGLAMNNFTWDAAFGHKFGKGAWWHDGSNGALSGFKVPISYGEQINDFALTTGDKVSFAVLVQSKTGTGNINLWYRFRDGGSYITAQVGTSVVANGSVQLIQFNDISIPANADDIIVYMADSGTETDFYILSFWAVPGESAGNAPPVQHMAAWETVLVEEATSGTNTTVNARLDRIEYEEGIDRKSPVFGENVTAIDKAQALYSSGEMYGKKAVTSTFAGWAAPFDWDGTSFDMLAVSMQTEFAGAAVQVTVWSGDQTTLLAEGYVVTTDNLGEYLVQLDKEVTGSAQTIYIAFQSYDGETRMFPGLVTGFVNVADPVTYPQKYITNTVNNHLTVALSTWSTVSGNTGWPMAFKLFHSEHQYQRLLAGADLNAQYNQLLTELADRAFDATSPVYQSATFIAHNNFSSTFSGWAMPFEWDGSAFDMIKIYYRAEQSGIPLRVAVWTGDKQHRVAYGEIIPLRDKGYVWVKLNRRVSTDVVTTGTSPVLYVAIDSPNGTVRLESQQCSNVDLVADPVTYPQLYTTIANPQENLSSWALVSGGGTSRPIPYELFDSKALLENPQPESGVYLSAPFSYEPILPPRLYGLEGIESNVYLKDLHSGGGKFAYDVVASALYGDHFEKRWRMIPSATPVNGGSMTFNVMDANELDVKGSVTTALWTVAHGACNTLSRRVCCIGDSTTAAGSWTQQMLNRAAEDTTDLQLTLVGVKGTAPNLHEGRGGWSVARYYQPSGADVAENPFVQNEGDKFNATYYLTSTAQTAPDIVIWHLAINDVFGQTTDAGVNSIMDTFIQRLDEMIGIVAAADVGSWKEANANVITLIALPISPTESQDAFGYNYDNTQNRARYKRNITVAAHRLNEHYKDKEADNIFLLPWNVVVDSEYNFPTSTSDANQHNTTQVTRQSNSVHPATSGYYQMGDNAYAALNVLVANGEA